MSERTVIAGIGCRRIVEPEDIVMLVDQALDALASGRGELAALAAPRFKSDEPALRQAAAALGVELALVDDAEMKAAQPRSVTRSDCAERAFGLASIAEGAALAAAGSDGTLILPRIANARATCALARKPR